MNKQHILNATVGVSILMHNMRKAILDDVKTVEKNRFEIQYRLYDFEEFQPVLMKRLLTVDEATEYIQKHKNTAGEYRMVDKWKQIFE